MREQFLDQMDLEREKGITIKLQPVRLKYKGYELNLIDTPGHVDFTYEVSRSLAAVEGAILLVDATQGIQAQTLGNLYLAMEHDLTIIPVVNKIDLPNAQVEKTIQELSQLIGVKAENVLKVSAKKGLNTEKILERIIKDVPPPPKKENESFKALIFDSDYNEFKGVIVYVRVFEGSINTGGMIEMMAEKKEAEILEVGYFSPELIKSEKLKAGQIGYLVTGLKDVNQVKVGDTVIKRGVKGQPLPGYQEIKPMVFASLFPSSGEDYEKLRNAIEKLKLNDASIVFTPEHSTALGFGFRCGFLGLLHLEIVQERLEREYNLEVVTTVPSVAYRVFLDNNKMIVIHNAEEWPDPNKIRKVEEPYVKVDLVTPKEFMGEVIRLVNDYGGLYKNTEYLNFTDDSRVILHYEMPLASILIDFYDKLKSVSSGYASLNYEFADYRPTEIEKMDILVAEERVPALSTLVYKKKAYQEARRIVDTLKEVILRHQFVIKVQGVIGGKIIASAEVKALRKDVTAKLYGGDVSRKKKLLAKQKKGKKKMRARGRVEIPSKAYLKVLKR